ncbi:hypothetical protein [Streptomyces sp. CB00455]|uniref:hypothetical protein n=1 Tax=Streptomyces sp. CB00455 TaxID=1703927 RepID=UPI00093AC696
MFTDELWPLYAVVTVLGAAYAPHLITAFALTERVVEPARLAEAMAFAASSLVAGQAVALAVCGRLAEAYGPAGAFCVAVGAAALCLTLALATRVPSARTPGSAFAPARQSGPPAPRTGAPGAGEPRIGELGDGEPGIGEPGAGGPGVAGSTVGDPGTPDPALGDGAGSAYAGR